MKDFTKAELLGIFNGWFEEHDRYCVNEEVCRKAKEQIQGTLQQKPKVTEKWIRSFAHTMGAMLPSEREGFTARKLEELGFEVEE